MAKFSRNLTIAKHAPPHLPFGGLDVITLRDFIQYPPVFDDPLYYNYDGSNVHGSTKQSDVLKQLGVSLRHQLTHAAFMTEQMRVTDAVSQDLLNKLRYGE